MAAVRSHREVGVNGCVAEGNISARAGSQLLRRGKLRRWVSASKLPSAGICATYTMLKDCNGAVWEIYNGIAGRGECLQQIQIMKKLLLAGIAALFLATGTAQAAEVKKDVLMVLLKEDSGETSLHYQTSPDCQKFLNSFRQLRKKGIAVRLKFFSPE